MKFWTKYFLASIIAVGAHRKLAVMSVLWAASKRKMEVEPLLVESCQRLALLAVQSKTSSTVSALLEKQNRTITQNNCHAYFAPGNWMVPKAVMNDLIQHLE